MNDTRNPQDSQPAEDAAAASHELAREYDAAAQDADDASTEEPEAPAAFYDLSGADTPEAILDAVEDGASTGPENPEPSALVPTDEAARAIAKIGGGSAPLMTFTPQDFAQSWELAEAVCKSGIVAKDLANKPGACFAVMARGALLGLHWSVAVTEGHVVHGRVGWPAAIIAAVVETSPVFEYFDVVEADNDKATVEAKRHDWNEPRRYTVTLEDARQMGFLDGKHSQLWTGQRPMPMLIAMARREAGRLWDPVRCAGLYDPDELAGAITGESERPAINRPREVGTEVSSGDPASGGVQRPQGRPSVAERNMGGPTPGGGPRNGPPTEASRFEVDLDLGAAAGADVVEEAWQAARSAIQEHSGKGALSVGKVKAIMGAGRGNGWSFDAIRSSVAAYLGGVTVEEIPYPAFQPVLSIFQSFKPTAAGRASDD